MKFFYYLFDLTNRTKINYCNERSNYDFYLREESIPEQWSVPELDSIVFVIGEEDTTTGSTLVTSWIPWSSSKTGRV